MDSESDRKREEKCDAAADAAVSAMVLAAGRGERMRPLTDHRPKPLLEAGGRPLIGWQLVSLADAGIRRVVVNLGWLGEQIRDLVGDGRAYGLQITYLEEGFPALETGGGILNALPFLGGDPFLVINGDIWSDVRYADLRCPRESLAHLLLVPNPEHNPGGDFRLDGDRVGPRGPGALTFSGIGLYRAELFRDCQPGRFPLAPVLDAAIRRNQVTGQLHAGEWLDVGDPDRLERLRRMLDHRSRRRPDPAP